MGNVNKTVGRGILGAPRIALQALAVLIALLALAPAATASHDASDPHGVRIDALSSPPRIHYLARDSEQNNVLVTETETDYVFTESGAGIPPVENPGGGCTVAAGVATCPKAGIESIRVAVFDLNDTVTMNANPPNQAPGTIIDGGSGNDELHGGPGNDDIFGGPGDDTLFGHDGLDLIAGDDGDDTILTGPGGPVFVDPITEEFRQQTAGGGPGYDTVTYQDRPGPGGIVYGQVQVRDSDTTACPDTNGCFDIHQGNFEVIIGTDFNDELVGGTRADVFVGRAGDDTICGGLGVDTVDYSDSPQGVNVTLDGTLATDVRHTFPTTPDSSLREFVKARSDCRGIEGELGQRDCTPNDGIPGVEHDCVGEDIENIIGSQFDDVLVGNDPDIYEGLGPKVEPHGINDIEGRGGNDLIDGGLGPDALSGDSCPPPAEQTVPCVEGIDTVTYASRSDFVSAAIDGAPNDGTAPIVGTVLENVRAGDYDPRLNQADTIEGDVENIIGGSAGDILRGDGDANRLQGGPGPDFIDGGDGADQLEGAEGSDTIVGGGGNDTLLGEAGDDVLSGEAGNDNVQGGTGADTASGGKGGDILSGGDDGSQDTLDYSDATTPVRVAPDGINNDGPAGEGDHVIGDFEVILGGMDDDVLAGGPASELIMGGDGNDRLDGGGGADDLSGGAGTDTASYEARGASVFVNLAEAGNDGEAGENDNVRGDVEKVLGGSGGDVLLGDAGANVLLGGAGNDRLAGAEGDDLLIGDIGDDDLSGDVGNDTLLGSDGNDNLSGADGNDDLKGEAGNDTMDGGPGKDRIFGGPHIDTILYSARSADVTVTLDGEAGNGERSENDFINHDVESVTTGRGNDTIDADDNLKGEVKCGAGADLVTVDPDDRVAGDCENVRVAALGTRCTASTGSVRMSRSGAIRVRVFCAAEAKGTLRLQSVARLRVGRRSARRVLKLGSKSFSLKAGQRRNITVKASKTARRYIQRKKRLSVRARISAKAKTQRSTLRTSRVFTVRGPR